MRRGLTLIEQLGALVLAAMLAIALFAVLSRIASRRASATVVEREAKDLQRVADLIEHDLVDSRRVVCHENSIHLSGFASLDPATGLCDHRPVHVDYQVESGDHSPRLIRQQYSLDVLSNHDTWTELAGDHIQSIRLTPLGLPSPSTRPYIDQFGAAAGEEVCRSYRLVLIGEGGSPPFERVLSVR